MVTAIFTELGTILTEMVGLFGNVFNGVAGLFYTAGTGSEAGTLTLFGILSLISVGSGLLFFGLKWIKNLISLR